MATADSGIEPLSPPDSFLCLEDTVTGGVLPLDQSANLVYFFFLRLSTAAAIATITTSTIIVAATPHQNSGIYITAILLLSLQPLVAVTVMR